ncbi:MAG: hypothetical protein IT168_04210 [Bryobacterales bacterium]|nr:hypothetical protein [Bryobacterales bacterium]
MFEELLAALSTSIPFEGAAETAEEDTQAGDLDKQEDPSTPKDEDSKPAWRTGFGWLQFNVSAEPVTTPVNVLPGVLGNSVQNTSATSIESTPVEDAAAAAGTSNADIAQLLANQLDQFNTVTGPKVNGNSTPQQSKQTVAPPLAFELKLNTDPNTDNQPEPVQPDPIPKSVVTSQLRSHSEMGSQMEQNTAKPSEQNLASDKPELVPEEDQTRRAESPTTSVDSVGRPAGGKDGKSNADTHKNQTGGDSHPHEAEPGLATKTHNTVIVEANVGEHRQRFTSELRQAENAPAQSVTETAPITESNATPAQPVTSLRLHLESENSATPVELTVKERAGQVRIEVRDANLGRNVELREQLPDLLRRLEEQGFRGEATGGIGREIAFSASSDANAGSNADQQPQQQQHGSGERRHNPRSDGDDDPPSQRNRQDRSKWQSAWFDLANKE